MERMLSELEQWYSMAAQEGAEWITAAAAASWLKNDLGETWRQRGPPCEPSAHDGAGRCQRRCRRASRATSVPRCTQLPREQATQRLWTELFTARMDGAGRPNHAHSDW
eukprot:81641-Chlamydomonas_euryale.AAC.26